RQREQQKLEDKRRAEEAIRIVAEKAPELAALRQAISMLSDYAASAGAYRPKFIRPSALKFRQVLYSFPVYFLFPRNCEGVDDGPDPDPWVTTVDNLFVPKPHELQSIYEKSMETDIFPCTAPLLTFEPPPPPQYPQVELLIAEFKSKEAAADKNFLMRFQKL